MPLTFTPCRAVYHPAGGVVRFFATNGFLFVRCCVSKRALIAINDASPDGPAVWEWLYNRHRTRIQETADRKYRENLVDPDGMIVVCQRDVEALEREIEYGEVKLNLPKSVVPQLLEAATHVTSPPPRSLRRPRSRLS